MYIVGIAGRAYYNKDNQKIIQTHEATRRFLSKDKEIVCITILPTEDENYIDINPGSDKINKEKLDHILNICDAFIIPGGTYAYQLDEYIIKHAIKNDKPLLAICLGFQTLCSMFSKNRTQFDMTEKKKDNTHANKPNIYSHKVLIQDNTKLKEIINESIIPVNSVHHDIVAFPFHTLKINAISEDGIIEGVEYPNKKFIIGLQWHPEYLKDKYSDKIKESFTRAIKNKNIDQHKNIC